MKYQEIYHVTKSVLQQISALMISTNMPLTQDLRSIPKLGYLRPSSKSDSRILSTSQKKTPVAIDSFDPRCMPNPHSTIITLRAAASLRKQMSSVSHLNSTLCASTPNTYPAVTHILHPPARRAAKVSNTSSKL